MDREFELMNRFCLGSVRSGYSEPMIHRFSGLSGDKLAEKNKKNPRNEPNPTPGKIRRDSYQRPSALIGG
jgi:hypothetical protein